MNKNNTLLLIVGLVYATLLMPTLVVNYTIILLLVVCAYILVRQKGAIFFKINITSILLIVFFLFHVVGLLYTENHKAGYFDLEKKMTLFLVPLLLGPILNLLHVKDWRKLRIWLGIISIASSVVYICLATVKLVLFHDQGAFHFEAFIPYNYVYYSYYLSFTILCLIMEVWDNKTSSIWKFLMLFFLPAYTLSILIIVSSKMGIISFLLGYLILIIFKIKNYKVTVVSYLVVIIVTVVALSFNATTLDRFLELKEKVEIIKKDQYVYNEPFTGLTLRLAFWKVAIQHMIDERIYLLGNGTGDAQDFLDQAYTRHNLDAGGYKGFNTHNQWVQTFLQLGIVGVTLWGMLFMIGFIKAFQIKSFSLILFLMVTLCFSISESILEVNKGIVFFSLLYTLLTNEQGDFADKELKKGNYNLTS